MYIYNRINRFQVSQAAAAAQPRPSSFGYKIDRHSVKKNNKKKTVRVGGSPILAVAVNKRKLKPLTKRNIEYLTELGFKVNN